MAQADGGIDKLMKEVVDLRQRLKDREQLGGTCVAEANDRLASAHERAAALLEDLFKQKVNYASGIIHA